MNKKKRIALASSAKQEGIKKHVRNLKHKAKFAYTATISRLFP